MENSLFVAVCVALLICGLALGYADPDVVPNSLITERAPIQDFTTWFSE